MKKKKHTIIFTDNLVSISGNCTVTGKPYSVIVPEDDYYDYLEGKHIQRAMPSVSPEDREFILTGISPEGWKQLFQDEEEM